MTGLSAALWDRLTSRPRPAGLHPFEEIRSGPRVAVATAGDLLFHIRAARMDLCFELASQIMDRLRGYEAAGVGLMLLQFSPQREEMARFGRDVISRWRS